MTMRLPEVGGDVARVGGYSYSTCRNPSKDSGVLSTTDKRLPSREPDNAGVMPSGI